MKLTVRKSEFFLADLDIQFRWYETEASADVAWRYLLAVDRAIEELAGQPDLGRKRHFQHPELLGLRSYYAARPFHRHLIFYRHDEVSLDLMRGMHGARDLPRRLRQLPETREDESTPQ